MGLGVKTPSPDILALRSSLPSSASFNAVMAVNILPAIRNWVSGVFGILVPVESVKRLRQPSPRRECSPLLWKPRVKQAFRIAAIKCSFEVFEVLALWRVRNLISGRETQASKNLDGAQDTMKKMGISDVLIDFCTEGTASDTTYSSARGGCPGADVFSEASLEPTESLTDGYAAPSLTGLGSSMRVLMGR